MKKAFCSGSFDCLHSGHITFLQEAAKYGNLFVGIGNDRSIELFKGKKPVCNEAERVFMLSALKCVTKCFVNSGLGPVDFLEEIKDLQPDFLIVNEDQDSLTKKELCDLYGIKYIVLKRFQLPGLPARSSTEMRKYFES